MVGPNESFLQFLDHVKRLGHPQIVAKHLSKWSSSALFGYYYAMGVRKRLRKRFPSASLRFHVSDASLPDGSEIAK